MVLIKYHYTSISIAKVTKVTKPNAVKDVEKLNLLFIAGTSTLENSLAVSFKTKKNSILYNYYESRSVCKTQQLHFWAFIPGK